MDPLGDWAIAALDSAPRLSWRPGPPDYVGVGAQKAGTSWWATLIAAHPTVRLHPLLPKELHYFDSCWMQHSPTKQLTVEYHRHFLRPPGMLTGEWTPSYMTHYWVPPLLAMAAPAARILVLLRDPVERFRSELTHSIRMGRARNQIATVNRVFHRGLYVGQLTRLFTAFPREQVLILQFERCVMDPAGELERTYQFIGLDSGFRPSNLRRPVNRTVEDKVHLSGHQEDMLREAYSDEVRRLGELVPALDLSLWSAY